jgi:hypothetical protein
MRWAQIARRGMSRRRYCDVPYSRSFPLGRWLGSRREAIEALAQAHAHLGEVDGPGRPLEIGRPVAHAYVLRVVAEFQAFARDLHDLAVETIVRMSGAGATSQAVLVAAATLGRMIDRGNADLRSLEQDFRRIGNSGISGRIASRSARWSATSAWRGDRAYYQDLIEPMLHPYETRLIDFGPRARDRAARGQGNRKRSASSASRTSERGRRTGGSGSGGKRLRNGCGQSSRWLRTS